jgi:hypothetical protein
MVNGVCKLTGASGRFVDAHLIPKALTRPAERGLPFVQSGQGGQRPVRRWSSWSDKGLVTQVGEDILTALDTWAIPQLRKHQLVWSGWGPMQSLAAGHEKIPGTSWGVRTISGIDPTRLRLFFLSLLWRAAATDRPEFAEIVLPLEDQERLRQMLVEGSAGPIDFYPAHLIQLSTMGTVHNLAPLRGEKVLPATESLQPKAIPIFRFYFDGLIAHIHVHSSDDGDTQELGPMVVGADDELIVSTVTYEHSFERENLGFLMEEAHRDWPEVMAKI